MSKSISLTVFVVLRCCFDLLTALVSTINTQVVLLEPIANFSIAPIFPIAEPKSNTVLHSAFNGSGPGHYDTLVEKEAADDINPRSATHRCSCGKKKNMRAPDEATPMKARTVK